MFHCATRLSRRCHGTFGTRGTLALSQVHQKSGLWQMAWKSILEAIVARNDNGISPDSASRSQRESSRQVKGATGVAPKNARLLQKHEDILQ